MISAALLVSCLSLASPCQDGASDAEESSSLEAGEADGAGDDEEELSLEELDALLPWRTGEVLLGNGLVKLHLPADFRYLDPEPSQRVLEELWGNPPDDQTWGMIFPTTSNPFSEDSWAVVLSYVDDGHVSDDDASEIDYEELLEDMQEGAREASAERSKAGYGTLEILGWATPPHYEPVAHRLHWAKEIRFDASPETTLNYDVRFLGREGVLSMNAVAGMQALAEVQAGMTHLVDSIEFGKGNRYEDFDSSVDNLAAYGIGGLIAGKLAMKAGLLKGLLALLIAGKKLILVGVVMAGAFLSRIFRRKADPNPTE